MVAQIKRLTEQIFSSCRTLWLGTTTKSSRLFRLSVKCLLITPLIKLSSWYSTEQKISQIASSISSISEIENGLSQTSTKFWEEVLTSSQLMQQGLNKQDCQELLTLFRSPGWKLFQTVLLSYRAELSKRLESAESEKDMFRLQGRSEQLRTIALLPYEIDMSLQKFKLEELRVRREAELKELQKQRRLD